MNPKKADRIVGVYIVVGFLVPMIFETCGLFTPAWLVDHGLSMGLFNQRSNVSSMDSDQVLDRPSQQLHIAALSLLLISTVWLIVYVWGRRKVDDILYVLVFALATALAGILYVISSFLSFGGCVRFAVVYPVRCMGPSFYLCVAAFTWMWIMALVFLTSICTNCVGLRLKKCIRWDDADLI